MAASPLAVPPMTREILIFDILQFFGGSFFLVILITTLLSSRINRSGPWLAFCFSWVLTTITYTMMVFAGKRYTGNSAGIENTPEVGLAFCSVQAVLIYSAPCLEGAAALTFVASVYFRMKGLIFHDMVSSRRPVVRFGLILLPYVVWILTCLGYLIVAVRRPDLVQVGTNGIYCNLNTGVASKVSSCIVLFWTVLLLLLEVTMCRMLYMHRNVVKDSQVSLSIFVRMLVFTNCGILALALNVAFVATWTHGVVFDLVLGFLPTAAALIFGTQAHILQAWTSCCRRERPEPIPATPTSIHVRQETVTFSSADFSLRRVESPSHITSGQPASLSSASSMELESKEIESRV